HPCYLSISRIPTHPSSTLFPYTTLFRSRDVGEQTQPVPIGKRTQEPGFRAILLDLSSERRADVPPRGQHGTRRLAQELVCHHHLVEHAVVHRLDERVADIPLLRVQVAQPEIAPRD